MTFLPLQIKWLHGSKCIKTGGQKLVTPCLKPSHKETIHKKGSGEIGVYINIILCVLSLPWIAPSITWVTQPAFMIRVEKEIKIWTSYDESSQEASRCTHTRKEGETKNQMLLRVSIRWMAMNRKTINCELSWVFRIRSERGTKLLARTNLSWSLNICCIHSFRVLNLFPHLPVHS